MTIYEYRVVFTNLVNGLDDCVYGDPREVLGAKTVSMNDLGLLGWRIHSIHKSPPDGDGFYVDILLLERATPAKELDP